MNPFVLHLMLGFLPHAVRWKSVHSPPAPLPVFEALYVLYPLEKGTFANSRLLGLAYCVLVGHAMILTRPAHILNIGVCNSPFPFWLAEVDILLVRTDLIVVRVVRTSLLVAQEVI